MFFMSKQFSLPKISSILQKMKIGQKTDIRPFCTKAFTCFKPKLRKFSFSRAVRMMVVCEQIERDESSTNLIRSYETESMYQVSFEL